MKPRLIQVRASARADGAVPKKKMKIMSATPMAAHMYHMRHQISISTNDMMRAPIRPRMTAAIMVYVSRGRVAPSFMVCQVALVTIRMPKPDASRHRKSSSLSVPFQK